MSFNVSRFKGIEKHEYECEVVTPLFLGGANPKEAELRTASIKGLIRFWWRAKFGSNNMKDMKEREAEIFGSTEKQAVFSVQINNYQNLKGISKDLPEGEKVPVNGKAFKISIIYYLAFGLCEYKKELRKNVFTKEYIPVGSKFKLCIMLKNKNYEAEIIQSLKMFLNFGGLGARSRNGFGSLYCKELLDNHIKTLDMDLKSFTSLSDKSRLFNKFGEKDKWEDALSEIGKIYRDARLSVENKHKFEKRGLVAMPIEAKFEKIPIDIRTGRHAKPYFLHVNKLDNGKYKGQILFMPYKYFKTEKNKEYFEACNKMNEKIGGSK